MDYRFDKLATLGDTPIDQLTSSFYVARKRNLAREIVCFSSFEAATDAVKKGEAEVALVPGAYPKIRAIIMDEKLLCVEAFVEQIPPLVVCGLQAALPSKVARIFLHPSTRPLVSEITTSCVRTVDTETISLAAARAKEDEDSLAICNKLAADYFGLHVLQELRPGLSMPFALFQAR